MCRILSYLGMPAVMEEFLYKPDNSFIKQSYHPKYMSHILNLAGFGMAAWDKSSHDNLMPFIYKTPQLPFYDENLKNLASKISPHCLLAHLRGVPYQETQVVANQNVHPFIFPNTKITMAHNGHLYNFDEIRFDLIKYIKAKYLCHIQGTTDSEWIYAIFLSQLSLEEELDAENITNALVETLKILKYVRNKYNIAINSPVNLFITNGEFIAATRFVLDYGWFPQGEGNPGHLTYHSLWYTYGERYGYFDEEYKMKGARTKTSVIIASEPLTKDTTTWLAVPEYTLLFAKRIKNKLHIISRDISI